MLCFQVFAHGADQLLSRSWLLDPVRSQISSSSATTDSPAEPWNGEFYSSFGESESRSWADAVEFGFICAGGGVWYSRTLNLLKPGDRVWVKIPNWGFVGVGRVEGQVTPAATFSVKDGSGNQVPVLEVAKRGDYHRQFVEDPEKCEYFVPVHWIQTVPSKDAIYEIGLFGNQNSVCKPTTPKWRLTVDRLKQKFPKFDEKFS